MFRAEDREGEGSQWRQQVVSHTAIRSHPPSSLWNRELFKPSSVKEELQLCRWAQTAAESLGVFSRRENAQAYGRRFAKVVGGNYNQSGDVSLQICELFSINTCAGKH